MKTTEQIKQAQETIKLLQDYVELARCQKKLRVNDNIETVDKQIDKTTKAVKSNVEAL